MNVEYTRTKISEMRKRRAYYYQNVLECGIHKSTRPLFILCRIISHVPNREKSKHISTTQ